MRKTDALFMSIMLLSLFFASSYSEASAPENNGAFGCAMQSSPMAPVVGMTYGVCRNIDERLSGNQDIACEVFPPDTVMTGTAGAGPFAGQGFTSHKFCKHTDRYWPVYWLNDGFDWIGCDGLCG